MKLNYRTKIFRQFLCVLITSVFILHITNWFEIPILERLDNIAYDLRLRTTLPNSFDKRIVIVDIDEKSLSAEGRWPWSRKKISELSDILFDHYHVKVLAFDVIFSEPDRSSGLQLLEQLATDGLQHDTDFLTELESIRPNLEYDQLLANSLKDRATILGFFTSDDNTVANESAGLPESIGSTSDFSFTDFLIHSRGYGANLKLLQDAAATGGFFNNALVDSDGSFRRLPLVTVYNGQIYESLSLAILRTLFDSVPVKFNTVDEYESNAVSRLESIEIDSINIPVDQRAAILVPFRGRQGSFTYIPATDILNFETPIEALQDKIVIVGTTAAGLLDLRATPIQNTYPGVEIHANIVSGMLDQVIKYRPGFMIAIEFIILLFIAYVGIAFFPRLSAVALACVFISLCFFIGLSNLYLWVYLDMDSLLATPFLLLSVLFAVQITFSYLLEARHKQHLSHIFGQYIPRELVSQMSDSEEEFTMQGESREMSVLFTDVRGFTSISEHMDPQELTVLINEILTPVTRVIHHNKGTIDKYMGDAVMAFWGAPLHNPNHAVDAVHAALAIIPAIAQVEQEFLAKGWPTVKVGVGINTGKMNVGNMGSEFRMAYTVVGDAVNLGSRLEGLTKQYGVNIIVSESTKSAAPEFVYKELDRVRVKGKEKAITIFEPIGEVGTLDAVLLHHLQLHSHALQFYRQQKWHDASRIWLEIQQQYPGEIINQIYLQRIEIYRQEPPAKNWDGVFIHTSK